jgi:hypothetical protein
MCLKRAWEMTMFRRKRAENGRMKAAATRANSGLCRPQRIDAAAV